MPRMADLEGRWQVSRRIADRLGPEARFAGEAEILPDGDRWQYAERGTLTLAGQPGFAAHRVYKFAERDGGADVFFEDGRFFHAFDWEAAEAEHLCGADLYRVRYDFGDWPDWSAVWTVAGPRKDYVMTSTYRRSAAAMDSTARRTAP